MFDLPALLQSYGLDVGTVVMQAITVVSLFIAFYQVADASKQKREARDQSEKLKRIADSLSTKYIGRFPDYIDEIEGVIERAEHELLILSTLPLIGAVRAPEKWWRLGRALDGRLHGTRRIPVKAVFADARTRPDFFRQMFREAVETWPTWIARPENRTRIDDFAGRFECATPIATADDYLAALECAVRLALERTYKGAEIFEMGTTTTLSLWIADSSEAVLAIRTFAARDDSHAFLTADTQLVQALRAIHAEHMKLAQPRH